MKFVDKKINIALAAFIGLAYSASLRESGEIHLPVRKEGCSESPEQVNFFEAALGPLYDSQDDLSILWTPTDDHSYDGDFITISITQLAKSFNHGRLKDTPFMQEDETFGHDGDFTAELLAQHELATEFWKLDEKGVSPVLLVGLHSEVLFDVDSMEKAIRLYISQLDEAQDVLDQITDYKYQEAAAEAQLFIETIPGNYSNPLLTFQVFAIPTAIEGSPLIVLGDGIMDFAKSVERHELTIDILHAREFGRVLQLITGLEVDNLTTEMSHRIDLTADAYASYFLAHEKGQNLEVPLLLQAARFLFVRQDCELDDNHHDTLQQRECARLWGAKLAKARPGTDPIGFRELKTLFDENVQAIMDGDYSVCGMNELSDTTASYY